VSLTAGTSRRLIGGNSIRRPTRWPKFTAMNTNNNTAPQTNAASCGQRQCPVCGKSFYAKIYAITAFGNIDIVRNRKSNQKYCSRKCRRKHDYSVHGVEYINQKKRWYREKVRPKIIRAHNSFQCIECGQKLSEHGRADRKYCSHTCEARYSSRKNRRINADKNRTYQREWARNYRKNDPALQDRHTRYVELCQWRSKNKEQLVRDRNRRKYVKHRDEYMAKSKAWAKNNPTRKRETDVLFHRYGTSKVVPLCRKIMAIERALRHGVLDIHINHISEGRTYEAYI